MDEIKIGESKLIDPDEEVFLKTTTPDVVSVIISSKPSPSKSAKAISSP